MTPFLQLLAQKCPTCTEVNASKAPKKTWGGRCHYPIRSLHQEAGPSRVHGCSATSQLGCSPRSLVDQSFILKHDWAKEKRPPQFWCVTAWPVKGSSCFRRKPDSWLQGLELLAPGSPQQDSFYSTQKLTKDFSASNAVLWLTVHLSQVLEQVRNAALSPPALTSHGCDIVMQEAP